MVVQDLNVDNPSTSMDLIGLSLKTGQISNI